MTYIDWSDAETMFGLLVEYVADAHIAEREATRQVFLSGLHSQLEAIQDGFEDMLTAAAVLALRDIRQTVDPGFAADDVLQHLTHCIVELERVSAA